ncbi:MAG TPA: T9SS type A sorting domain-containing protein [Chitinophagales bacterium]|nr:T9SS type A sorting domain-containing protein [Chitinophagales bacterium]HRK28159.1 T9SS type A sorting domain-containing protein [Chitinophagales bacterium]
MKSPTNRSFLFVFSAMLLFCYTFIARAQTGFDQPLKIAPMVDRPYGTLAADLDNDGDKDIVAMSYLSTTQRKVVIFENIEGVYADFPISPLAPTENGEVTLYLADLDNDNYIDLVLGFGNKIAWSKNNGNFNFGSLQVITTAITGLKSLQIIDFDNDGDLDLLSASKLDHKIAYYENSGNGIFTNQIVVAEYAYYTEAVAALDVDNDGLTDIISGAASVYGLGWHKNYGNGIFGYRQVISATLLNPIQIVVADMNNDGILDLVVSVGATKYLFLRDATFSFIEPIVLYSGGWAFTLSDFDADGNIDLLFPLTNNSLCIMRNYGYALLGEPEVLVNFQYPFQSYSLEDINNNGLIDIIYTSSFSSGRVEWYENIDNATFVQHILAETENILYDIFTADLDNDGDIDVLSASWGDRKIAWYENLGNGNFDKVKAITRNAWGANTVFADDLNNDGYIDVLSASYNDDKIAWYQNEGQGIFSEQMVITGSADAASAVATADLDNDGDADVIAANYYNQLFWFANDGAGNFTLQQTFNIATGAKKVMAADINNDGLLDLVFASSASENAGTLGWFRNIGEGVFNTTLNPIAYWAGIEDFDIADIDNDGLPDVLAVSTYYNTSGWFKNFENGVYFEERLICNCHASPICITTADFDNDGDFDVVVGTRAGRIVSWYENDSAGNFEPADINISEIIEPKAIRVADINNDGYKDVVVGFSSQSQILWYKNLFLNIAAPSNEVDMPVQTQILHLAPNPTQNTLTLTYTTPDAQPLALHLYDLAGKLMYSQANLPALPGIHTATLQLQHLPKGMYLLTLFNAQTALRAKVVKE